MNLAANRLAVFSGCKYTTFFILAKLFLIYFEIIFQTQNLSAFLPLNERRLLTCYRF